MLFPNVKSCPSTGDILELKFNSNEINEQTKRKTARGDSVVQQGDNPILGVLFTCNPILHEQFPGPCQPVCAERCLQAQTGPREYRWQRNYINSEQWGWSVDRQSWQCFMLQKPNQVRLFVIQRRRQLLIILPQSHWQENANVKSSRLTLMTESSRSPSAWLNQHKLANELTFLCSTIPHWNISSKLILWVTAVLNTNFMGK